MDFAVAGYSASVGVRSLGRFRRERQCRDSLWRRKRWNRSEHYMAMVCAWKRLEKHRCNAIASIAGRCRYGLFACLRPPGSLWWAKQRDTAERYVDIHTLRP